MFLMCHSEENVKFLDSIVKGDETWVFHHTWEQTTVDRVAPPSFSHKKEIHNQPQPRILRQLSSQTKMGFFWLILCLIGPPKHCSILWNEEKALTCNLKQKTGDADMQHLLTAWQHEGAHCKSYTAVVAEFQLGGFGQSRSDPMPRCQQFPFVFILKETSGRPEFSRRQRGEKQSLCGCMCRQQSSMASEYKPHTQPKQMPWQRW